MGTAATWEYGAARAGSKVFSPNYGAELMVVHVSFGKVSVESVLAGEAEAQVVYLSADGRGFKGGWAENADASSADAVYVEIKRAAGRDFHGWIDAVSRKLVQAG